ncbi:MAG: HAMP domain-containing sensor histidine kinase [Candidatus Competibacteraceae bacterium]|nr:HAMP domain-containing sensor histidine kinase [Candidatus Competibacteraceae bacterium]
METERIKQLEQLLAVGTLTAGTAHKLNNPLNAILMNAELGLLMLKKSDGLDKLSRILRTIAQEAQHGGVITRELSEFARAKDYTPKDFSEMNAIVHTARNFAGVMLRRQNVDIVLKLHSALPKINVNRLAMALVVTQLLVNATESQAKTVNVVTEADEQTIALHVIDDGEGISPDIAERVFEPFFTTRQSQGSPGLGLSLVKRIVDDHRGTVTLKDITCGTHFIVRLPR